jgi:hypothetical protein
MPYFFLFFEMNKYYVVMITLILFIPIVYSEEYHVKLDGNNSLDGLSNETAWQTITFAANNALENSEIFVYGGEYLEDESYGYMYINNPNENITLASLGEVIIRVNPDSYRIIHFGTPSLFKIGGFILDGQNSVDVGITSNSGNKILDGNKFINILDRGISLDNAEGVFINGNRFGELQNPINFKSIWLTDSNNIVMTDNQFFTEGGDIISAFSVNNSSIIGNRFGSEDYPIFLDTYSKFVRVIDSDNFVAENNEFYIGDGNGIIVHTSSKAVENPRLINNSFFIYHSLNRYGISVGSESEQDFGLRNAEILDNKLYMPIEETSKHNLFVGFTNNSIVSGNYLDGGGYGLALKGNYNALIFDNEVYNATTVAIVDNAGWNNKIYDNIVNCNYNRCMRIDNTESAGRPLYNSSWYNNTMHISSGQFAIYIGSSVDIIESGSSFFDNKYYQDEHEQNIGSYNNSYFTFFDLKNDFGWCDGSDLFASEEIPEIENISVYGIQPTSVRVKFNSTESSTSILGYGVGALENEIEFSDYRLGHEYVLTGLQPKTYYIYQIRICDNEVNCVDSDILSFRTKKGGGPKLPYFSMVLGNGEFPYW